MPHVPMWHPITRGAALVAAAAVDDHLLRGWVVVDDSPDTGLDDEPAPEPETPAQEPALFWSGWNEE
jgi:hypothetical protein